MAYKEHDTVVLLRDLPEQSLRAGDLGAVVFVTPESIDVEFLRASGQTQALVMLREADVRPADNRDLIAVRQADPPSAKRN